MRLPFTLALTGGRNSLSHFVGGTGGGFEGDGGLWT